jgi:hypothetical protein
MLRIPHFLDNRRENGVEVVNHMLHWLHLPQNDFLVLVSIRGKVNPKAIVAGRIRQIEKKIQ